MTTTDTRPVTSTPTISNPGTASQTHQAATTSRTEKTRFLDRKGVKPTVGFLVPLVLLVAWWAVTAAEVFTAVQLPPPAAVFEAAVGLIQRGDLWMHIGISVQRVLI